MNVSDEERLDHAVGRASALLATLLARQARLDDRLTTLYRAGFLAFGLLVGLLSFLSIILSQQVPGVTRAIVAINENFAGVANDMVRMESAVRRMGGYLGSLPEIVGQLDRMRASVDAMTDKTERMARTMTLIDNQVASMTQATADMRQSFALMEQQVGHMRQDVNRMSQPMRMFNWMTPFW